MVATPCCRFNFSSAVRQGGACARRRWRTDIYVIFQFLAWLEERDALGRHFDLGASLRVASRAATPLARPKTAEAANLDPVPACSAPMMLSKIVSTMASDSLRPSSVTRTTSSTRSAFVTVESFIDVCSAVSQIAPEGAWGESRRTGAPLARRKHFLWRVASGGISISPNEREGK